MSEARSEDVGYQNVHALNSLLQGEMVGIQLHGVYLFHIFFNEGPDDDVLTLLIGGLSLWSLKHCNIPSLFVYMQEIIIHHKTHSFEKIQTQSDADYC